MDDSIYIESLGWHPPRDFNFNLNLNLNLNFNFNFNFLTLTLIFFLSFFTLTVSLTDTRVLWRKPVEIDEEHESHMNCSATGTPTHLRAEKC